MRRLCLTLLAGALAAGALTGCGVSAQNPGAPATATTALNAGSPVGRLTARPPVFLSQRPSGEIAIDGSTRGSLSALAAQAYTSADGVDRVQIANNGENAAFSELCGGKIDLVDSARPISSAELAACTKAGLRVVQLQVASDAIVLATKSETDVGADCVTVKQVNDTFRAGSPVYNWQQLGFDDVPLTVAGPNAQNNAFSFFGQYVLGSPQPSLLDFRSDYHSEPTDQQTREYVVGSAADAKLTANLAVLQSALISQQGVLRGQRAILSGDEATLTGANRWVRSATFQVAKGIADNRTLAAQNLDQTTLTDALAKQASALAAVAGLKRTVALDSAATRAADRAVMTANAAGSRLAGLRGRLGFFRFSYYQLFEDELRPLEVSEQSSPENCIFPSEQTITSAVYPLARQLLITVPLADLQRADVRTFLLSYLHHSVSLATQAQMVPLPTDILNREEAWLAGGAQTTASGQGVTSTTPASAPSTATAPALTLVGGPAAH